MSKPRKSSATDAPYRPARTGPVRRYVCGGLRRPGSRPTRRALNVKPWPLVHVMITEGTSVSGRTPCMPTISVITAVHNGGHHFLRDTYESLREQKLPDDWQWE